MVQRARLVRRALILAVVVLALFGASVRTAGASPDACPSAPLAHPFLPWLDPAAYTLAPNGDLESGGAGWTLGGGAAVTALPLVTDGRVSVAFRFRPQGALGNWRIDDVYVDPLKGS